LVSTTSLQEAQSLPNSQQEIQHNTFLALATVSYYILFKVPVKEILPVQIQPKEIS